MKFSDLKDWLLKEREREVERTSKKYEEMRCVGRDRDRKRCEVTALVHRRHHAVSFTCSGCHR
jgi:hypothetical protein